MVTHPQPAPEQVMFQFRAPHFHRFFYLQPVLSVDCRLGEGLLMFINTMLILYKYIKKDINI